MTPAAKSNGSDPFPKQAPAVSVVIPLFNKEATIGRALESVFRQSVQDFEIIVVNDGSTDRSRQMVDAFQDPRLRVIDQPNAGAAAARNRGIAEARSELVAFLDADDEWDEDHLETLLDLKRRFPESDLIATSYRMQEEGGACRPAILRSLPTGWEGELTDYFEVAACSEPPIWTSAAAVSKYAVRAAGGFPEGVISGEDLLAWARLAVRGRVAFSSRPTATFHLARSHRFEVAPTERRPLELSDEVGKGLAELHRSVRGKALKSGLRKYRALWCRMRASTFLLAGERARAYSAIIRGLSLDPTQKRLYPYLILGLFPRNLLYRVFKRFASIRRLGS